MSSSIPTLNLSPETYNKTFIIITIIGGLVIVGIVAFLIIYIHSQSQARLNWINTNTRIQPLTNDTNLGAVSTLSHKIESKYEYLKAGSSLTKQTCGVNSKWINNECVCDIGHYGDKCQLEKHSDKYYAIGLDNNQLTYELLSEFDSKYNSFIEGSCANECDNDFNCIGYLFKNNTCQLLQNQVISTDLIPYSHHHNKELFLKNLDDLKFSNHIFIAKSKAYVHKRYWLEHNEKYASILTLNNLYRIKYIPTYINNFANYLGIYSKYPFTYEEAINWNENTEFRYLHYPKTELALPEHFNKWRQIYVMYIN